MALATSTFNIKLNLQRAILTVLSLGVLATAQTHAQPQTTPATPIIPITSTIPPTNQTLSPTPTNISATLLQLQQAAVDHNPDLKAKQASLDIANADIELAQSRYLPTVSANMSRNYGRGSGRFDHTNVSDPRTIESGKAGFNITQSLYDPTLKINLEQSKLTAMSNGYAITQSYDELTNRIVGLFFDILAAQAQLDLLKVQLALVAEQQAQAQKNFEVGTVSITDVREAEAKHDKVVAQQAALQWQYRSKQQELAILTGGLTINPQDYVASTKVLPSVDENELKSYMDTIADNNAQLQQAKLDYQISTLSDAKRKYQHYPRVQMVIDNYRNFEPMTQKGHTGYASNTWEWSVGLQASMNLFNPDTSLAQNTKAQAEQNQRYNTMQGLHERIATELQQTLYQILASNANYQGLHAAEQSAKTALSANRLGYQVGMRINADVLEAQNKVYEVNRDKLTAWYDSWRNYVKLYQLSGTLDEAQLAQIDELLRQAPEHTQVDSTPNPTNIIPTNTTIIKGRKSNPANSSTSQLKQQVRHYQQSLQPQTAEPMTQPTNPATPDIPDTGN